MHYCGLDVSRKSTHVYIEDPRGRRVKRMEVTPTELPRGVEQYAEQGLRVAVEAGNQTAWIVDVLQELGAKVHVGASPEGEAHRLIEEEEEEDGPDRCPAARTPSADRRPPGARARAESPKSGGAGATGGRGASTCRCGRSCSTWCEAWPGSSG